MKLIRLRHRKGFTLIECIIAIAVFAVMTSMVLMIMANTVNLSKKASDSEAGLNQLVQNVVQDNSNKTYGEDSRVLEMDFGGTTTNFRVSYSSTDGGRSLIRCPVSKTLADGDPNKGCGTVQNSTEYMQYLYSTSKFLTASKEEQASAKVSHWFDPNTSGYDKYECPSCGKSFTANDIYLVCLSCLYGTDESANPTAPSPAKASDFKYDSASGAYVCPDCDSGNVVQIYYNDGAPGAVDGMTITSVNENANYDFQINGIQSNAIRVGKLDEPDNDKRKTFTTIFAPTSTDPKCSINLTYQKNTNGVAGVYTLKITSLSGIDPAEVVSLSLTLPGAYVCRLLGTSNANVGDPTKTVDTGKPFASVIESKMYNDPSETSAISITNLTQSNYNGTVIRFTLCNYANNHSFDDDYTNEGGISKFWFGSTPNGMTVNIPRDDIS